MKPSTRRPRAGGRHGRRRPPGRLAPRVGRRPRGTARVFRIAAPRQGGQLRAARRRFGRVAAVPRVSHIICQRGLRAPVAVSGSITREAVPAARGAADAAQPRPADPGRVRVARRRAPRGAARDVRLGGRAARGLGRSSPAFVFFSFLPHRYAIAATCKPPQVEGDAPRFALAGWFHEGQQAMHEPAGGYRERY